jgi:hypothetical protein
LFETADCGLARATREPAPIRRDERCFFEHALQNRSERSVSALIFARTTYARRSLRLPAPVCIGRRK